MKNLFLKLVCSSLLLMQCLVYSIVQAETGYVVDQLLVGIHQEKNIDSPIIKVISTGTELQILERDGDYTRVREKEEGKMGWVDSSYVMLEKPAKLHLAELKESIKTNNQGVTSLNNNATSKKEIESLNKEIESLTQELSSEKLNTGSLEATISKQEKKLAGIEANSGDDLSKSLQEKNKALEKRIENLKQAKQNSDQAASSMGWIESLKLFTNKLVLIALGVIAILGVLLGRNWEDRKIRKRHGGFRI